MAVGIHKHIMYNATSKEVWKTWLAARCPHPKTSQGQHAVQMPLEHFHGILGGRSPRHHGHVYIYHNGPKVWPNNPSHLYATCIGARASQFGIRQKLRVSTRHRSQLRCQLLLIIGPLKLGSKDVNPVTKIWCMAKSVFFQEGNHHD